MTKRKNKRVFAGGDLHCGHMAGLTPPGYQYSLTGPKKQLGRQQRECWKFFEKQVEALKPFDVAFWNGDLIDGDGHRSSGVELIEPDRLDQAHIARFAIDLVGAKSNVMTFGTPYHTGQGEDWEQVLVDELDNAEIRGHAFVDVNGWVFDMKHKVGSSTVPHGRHTAVARERLWNLLWSEAKGAPKSQIILRSHVHYFDYCGGADWLGMTLPALQGFGSKYGERQCSGTVDFGFVHFDISKEGYQWQPHLLKIKSAFPKPIKC